MNRVELVLHIGQHKTGSKALQSFLAWHSKALKQRGILYPIRGATPGGIRAYAISHYRLFALLRREAMVLCGESEAAIRFWAEQRAFCHPFASVDGFFRALEAERNRCGAKTIILSAEDLFDMATAHELSYSPGRVEAGAEALARLAKDFHYEPRVVVYLRRQDHLMAAHYGQYIKGSSLHDMDFDDFAQAFGQRLMSRDILGHWVSAFGSKNVLVRPYEACGLPNGIVPDFFEQALRFAVPADYESPPQDRESRNISLDRDYVEFIRLLNRRSAQGLPVPAREDVLDAALEDGSEVMDACAAAAWLSPKARRELLKFHEEGNADIAKRFQGGRNAILFRETFPEVCEDWRGRPGLSPERSIDIAHRVQERADRRRSLKKRKERRRRNILCLLGFTGVALFIIFRMFLK